MVNLINIKSLKSEPSDTQLIQENDYGLWLYENCYDIMPFSGLNTFKICKENSIKVNLDGQGADEINAGYTRYWSNYFATKPFFSKPYIYSFIYSPMDFRNKIRTFLKIEKSSYPGKIISDKFKLEVEDEYRKKRVIPDKYVGITVNEALYNSVTFNLKSLLRNVDFYSMANSIESRQPFMDYRLITFLNSCPTQYKMHNGWTKYLARIAFKDKMPDEIVWRKDKLGWPQPLKQWLNGEFGFKAVTEIKESSFLPQILNSEISDEFISLLIKQQRPFLRLYNLSRQYDIFFNNGYKKLSRDILKQNKY
jgi:asparagine synthase (glutamine-hydrolysing)